MSSINPNGNIRYPNMNLVDSENGQQPVKSARKINETNASFNSRENIRIVKDTSKNTPIFSSPQDLAARGSSSAVTLADRTMGTPSPSIEETIQNDTGAKWAYAMKHRQQQPINDELIELCVEEELVRPSREITFLVLSQEMAGFNQLDKETQNRLIEQAREKACSFLGGGLKSPEMINPVESQNPLRHRKPQLPPLLP